MDRTGLWEMAFDRVMFFLRWNGHANPSDAALGLRLDGGIDVSWDATLVADELRRKWTALK